MSQVNPDALRDRLKRWYDDSDETGGQSAYRDPEVAFEDAAGAVDNYYWHPPHGPASAADRVFIVA